MSRVFTSERKIRFSHCDPAGIVYFVNFFDMINAIVEDWFADVVELPFQTMHMSRRMGFPVVNTACEFSRPCHLGDLLALELRVSHLGRSSLELVVTGQVGGERKFQARHRVAMISLDTERSVPIPDALRAKMRPYLVDEGSE